MTDRVYGWPVPHPDDGPFWTNRPDPAAFERILDHLFAISDVQWQAELAEHQFETSWPTIPGMQSCSRFCKENWSAPHRKGRQLINERHSAGVK